MTEISASLVRELREQTGAGMMDCKRALQETGGDLEAARKLLREKGMAQAGKRATRATNEGVVLQEIEGGVASMVAVGCESEPVSANEDFKQFAASVLERVKAAGPGAVESVEDARVELVSKIGENIVVSGAERFEASGDEVLAGYVHPPANKIGVLVKLVGGDAELGRLLAMHISFANPQFLLRDEIPAELVAEERDVYMKQPDVVAKPEQVREKIVEGMLKKRFFAEQVLVDQPWIHDAGKSVEQVLAERGAKVVAIRRFSLSE
ncbi:MAG: translation elongation factor Ts [Gaiellaceae bacterium]